MAKSSLLRVMISSRSEQSFPPDRTGQQLSSIRQQLKAEIEGLRVFGKPVFEVWINEETAPQPGTEDSWETCLQAAKDCDVFIALTNGDAGWAKQGSDVGICHAELMAALAHAPGQVRMVDIGKVAIANTAAGKRNERFQSYLSDHSLFRGATVTTVDSLKSRVREAVHGALIQLAQSGVLETSRGRFHSGQALDWNRLTFEARRDRMRSVLRDAMRQRAGSKDDGDHLVVSLAATEILFVPHAIPAALSIGAAREMVGQPFLRDHELHQFLRPPRGGPFHVIACHKSATETQAIRLLGFPDATIVSPPFGVFVADNIQKVQFAFIDNCRDETTTRHGVQRFFEWLQQNAEDHFVADRAQARARIVAAIARESGS
jgi:hypothetical protein